MKNSLNKFYSEKDSEKELLLIQERDNDNFLIREIDFINKLYTFNYPEIGLKIIYDDKNKIYKHFKMLSLQEVCKKEDQYLFIIDLNNNFLLKCDFEGNILYYKNEEDKIELTDKKIIVEQNLKKFIFEKDEIGFLLKKIIKSVNGKEEILTNFENDEFNSNDFHSLLSCRFDDILEYDRDKDENYQMSRFIFSDRKEEYKEPPKNYFHYKLVKYPVERFIYDYINEENFKKKYDDSFFEYLRDEYYNQDSWIVNYYYDCYIEKNSNNYDFDDFNNINLELINRDTIKPAIRNN